MTKDGRNRNAGPERAGAEEGDRAGNLLSGVHVVSNRISRAFAAEVTAGSGLRLTDWRIIVSLVERPGLTAREITQRWGMEKMAVNRAVRRLEEQGHVVVAPDPADRRRLALTLTESGRRLYREVEPAATRRYREITRALTAEERRTLGRLLGKLIRKTDEIA